MSTTSQTAAYLADMRFTHRRIEKLPDSIRPPDLNTAYQVQDSLVELLLGAHGGYRMGYKAACTNELAQSQLNVAGPIYGQMLTAASFQSPAKLKASDFSLRIVEIEFGIRLGKDVPALKASYETPYNQQTIQPFIEAVLPSIEIVSHRFADWSKVGAPTIAADNAIHGGWVYGKPYHTWHKLDLANLEVALIVNDEIAQIGQGSAVLGHPFNVVAWLANELPKHGKQLKRGDLITTGVVSDVYAAQAGDRIVGDFGVIGEVELVFE